MSTAAIRTAPFTCRLLTETLGRSRGRLPGLLACFERRPGGDADRASGRSCCRRATAGGRAARCGATTRSGIVFGFGAMTDADLARGLTAIAAACAVVAGEGAGPTSVQRPGIDS